MACDIQAILDESGCSYQYTPFQLEVAEVALLCSIKQFLTDGTTIVACDVQSLLTANPCVYQYTPFQLQVARSTLLCDIATLLGASGGCSIFSRRLYGIVDPEGVVTGCKDEMYLNTETGNRFVFAGTDGANTGWI